MPFPHIAKIERGRVSRDPLPALAEAMNGLLILHRELMAERDQTLSLTRSLCDQKQTVAELQCYVALLEREVTRLRSLPVPSRAGAAPDVEGWR